MAYPADQIRSDTPRTLVRITQRHADHCERRLFDGTDWQVAGPADVVRSVPPTRIVALTPRATFGALQIEAIETPHADVGHYSSVVTWHGKRLYFSGDTESSAHLTGIKQLDVSGSGRERRERIAAWQKRRRLRRAARRSSISRLPVGRRVPL